MSEEIVQILENQNTNTSEISVRDYFALELNTKESRSNLTFILPDKIQKFGNLQKTWIINQNSNTIFHVSSTKYLHFNLKDKQENHRFYSKEGIFKTDYQYFNNSFGEISLADNSENNDTELDIELIDLDRTKKIHEFLFSIKRLDNSKGEMEGMKELYRWILNYIKLKLFVDIDNTIKQFIASNFSFQFHIALLSITLNISDRLQHREKLIQSAISSGEHELDSKQKVYATLDGLI